MPKKLERIGLNRYRKPVAYRGGVRYVYYHFDHCTRCRRRTLTLTHKRSTHTFCSARCSHAYHSGAGNANWSGGRKYKRGAKGGHILVYCPGHPNARKNFIAEHRVIAEKALGRLLTREEVVHHIDCNPENNSPNNLVVLSKSNHFKAHGSLNKCVSWLLAKPGRLRFDQNTFTYKVSGDRT